MISSRDVVDAITMCSGYDPIHTPKADDDAAKVIIGAWLQHFSARPSINRAELLQAVARYWQTPGRSFPQPADISLIALDIMVERSEGDQTARYREAVSDALAARDAFDDPTEHAKSVNRAIEIIARHKGITRDEARAWIEEKRSHVQDRFRAAFNGEHAPRDTGESQRPAQSDVRKIITRDGMKPLKRLWELGRRHGGSLAEHVSEAVEDYAQGKRDPEAIKDVYERAYRRAGLLSGDPENITTRLPEEPRPQEAPTAET